MKGMTTCPHCGNSNQQAIAGYEVRGVYDGVLYWVCLACGHAWARWLDGPLGALSTEYAEAHNRGRR
jgi:hypothetical protein